MLVRELFLPDNSQPANAPVFFEGRLRQFDRRIGVVFVSLDLSASPERASDGHCCFRGKTAIILREPAVVELAYPFRVERIPAADGNYWRDLHVPCAQFEFPFVTTEDGQRGSRAGEPFLPGPVLDFRHTAPATPPTGMSHDLWSNVPVASESAVTVLAQETTVSRCDPARQPVVG